MRYSKVFSAIILTLVMQGCAVTTTTHPIRIRGEEEVLRTDARSSLQNSIVLHGRVQTLVETLMTEPCTKAEAERASRSLVSKKSMTVFQERFLEDPVTLASQLVAAADFISIAIESAVDIIKPAIQKCTAIPGSSIGS